MTLLKDNNYKEINVALLSLEADIKNKITNFDTSVIDKQLAEINSRIDKINATGNNTSAEINDIRYEIEDINSKLKGNSAKIEKIEQKLSDIFSAENKVTDFNATTDSGIYYWVNDAANKPANYGVLLVNKYDSGGNGTWINQIAYGTDNKIYFRQNINSGKWTDWKAVAFEGEIKALTVNGKTYDGSEAVDAGVQKIENGGTGVTTQADINKAFISNLDVGNSDVTDGTEFVSSYASDNGFAETVEGALNKPYKRQFVKVWNYIKGKISSVLGLTKDNYGGKAAKSSFLDEYVGAGGKRLTSGNIVPKDSSEYGGMRKDVVTSSMTDSGRPGVDGHLLTMFWDSDGRWDDQLFISNDLNAPPALKVRQKLNTADYGPWVDVITSNNIGSQTVAKAGTADRAIGIKYTGENIGCISAEQTSESFNNSDANWASYIICNHGNGTNYFHQMLRLPFFSDTIQLQRRVDGELQGWKNVAIMENENTWSGRQNFTTAKASSKMVIPIGAPSQLEDGCIWIER